MNQIGVFLQQLWDTYGLWLMSLKFSWLQTPGVGWARSGVSGNVYAAKVLGPGTCIHYQNWTLIIFTQRSLLFGFHPHPHFLNFNREKERVIAIVKQKSETFANLPRLARGSTSRFGSTFCPSLPWSTTDVRSSPITIAQIRLDFITW